MASSTGTRWFVQLTEIPVRQARLFLRVRQPAEKDRFVGGLDEAFGVLSPVVTGSGFANRSTGYIDLDLGGVADEAWDEFAQAFRRACDHVDGALGLAAVFADSQLANMSDAELEQWHEFLNSNKYRRELARAKKSWLLLRVGDSRGLASLLNNKDASVKRTARGALTAYLKRIMHRSDEDLIVGTLAQIRSQRLLQHVYPLLNQAMYRNPQVLGRAVARLTTESEPETQALWQGVVDAMDENPADKRFKVRVGDGIALGLIYVFQKLGEQRRMAAAVERYETLILSFPPKLQKAYVKELEQAKRMTRRCPTSR